MSIKTFEEGKKFSRRSWRVLLWGFSARNGNEIQTNCRVEFDVKKNKNKKLVGSYLRCAYNHVLLEKNFTALSNSLFNTSKIEDLFRACALSSPVTFLTDNNLIWPYLAFGFVNKRSGSLRCPGVSRIHFKQKESYWLSSRPILLRFRGSLTDILNHL